MGLLESALAVGIVDPRRSWPMHGRDPEKSTSETVDRPPVNEHCTGALLRWEVTHFD